MKDSKSLGSTLSFILADSSTYSCASNETIISRVSTMHIKWVLNWEAFEYPQQFNESWGTTGTVIGTRAQVIKDTVSCLEKQAVIQCITEATFLSRANQSYGRGTFRMSRSLENNVRLQRDLQNLVFFSLSVLLEFIKETLLPRDPSAP